MLVWMNERKLEIGHGYLLKHATQTVRATVDTVRYRININTLEKEPGAELGLNDIGAVVIQAQKPIFCDPYRRNRTIGSFILIDPMTNATVGAGMITGREPGTRQSSPAAESSSAPRISLADQESRAGHRAVTVWLDTSEDVAFQLERLLFEADCRVHASAASESTPEICLGFERGRRDRLGLWGERPGNAGTHTKRDRHRTISCISELKRLLGAFIASLGKRKSL